MSLVSALSYLKCYQPQILVALLKKKFVRDLARVSRKKVRNWQSSNENDSYSNLERTEVLQLKVKTLLHGYNSFSTAESVKLKRVCKVTGTRFVR